MKLFELLQNLNLNQKIMIVESDSEIIHETNVGSAFSIFNLENFSSLYIDGKIEIKVNEENDPIIIIHVYNATNYHL